MDFDSVCWFPALCQGCGKMVSVNMLASPIECSECGSREVQPYDSESLVGRIGENRVASWSIDCVPGGEVVLTNGDYLCPKCGNYALTFLDGGLHWD